MKAYVLRKLAYSAAVLLGVVTVVFWLFQGFGDPARMVLGQSGDAKTLAQIRKDLYLDQPRWKQFVYYLDDVSPLCVHTRADIAAKGLSGVFVGGNVRVGLKWPYLRRSYQTKKEVGASLWEALPGTLVLASAALLIAIVIGIPLGVLAALRPNNPTLIVGSVLGISAPSFFMGIVIAYLLGYVAHIGLPMTGSLFDTEPFTGRRLALSHLILPALTLGIRPLAIITQLTRSALLDVLGQDYIRTARAKGLPPRLVLWKHALRNALNPVITAVTGWFAELLAGAFFVEYIFGWKGIGKLTVDALSQLDYPIVMGSVLFSAAAFTLVNFATDILYGVVDPRARA
ncbi:MAG TPA: ABC transporter permease [Dinghuibacter sp.]|uniref:ABC transporter permease n=1 Tax=Dinghuibacter sp. TaxID=2024697 RepID=UPI002B552545|nr:ABC transporter permease [Dinghuibacter sp.]HTJ12906.1 ABC transporter permease [Dinghuibacter sp.]